MSVDGLVARARARAQLLMVDDCTITRIAPGAFNATTGEYAETSTVLYTGKCRLRSASAAQVTVTERVAGDAEQPTFRPVLLVPFGAVSAAVFVGDRVEVTGVALFKIVGMLESSTRSADAFLVEQITQATGYDSGTESYDY